MKRLRKQTGKDIRFFHCGEYGDENKRPHYHALIFGYDFPDKQLWEKKLGNNLYIFNRVHGLKTTFDSGLLVPIYVDEVLPGDTFQMNANGFGRLATPLYPVMDNCYLETFFFFVPNRLIWDNWEKFNGAQDDPDDSTDFLVPQIQNVTKIHQ